MRFHLVFHVVSSPVADLIDRYVKEKGVHTTEKYAPIKSIILACDRLVDIWNGNYLKGCECINSPNNPHLKELHSILLLFAEWKNQSNSKDEFIISKLWEDICWLVYGIEGIAQQYLMLDKSRQMNQRRGGSDVCEFEFAAFRQSSSNGSEFDICGIETRCSAY